jgi:hypothetical protein
MPVANKENDGAEYKKAHYIKVIFKMSIFVFNV